MTTERADDLAGVADGFGRLWTPHRLAYIEGAKPPGDPGDSCPFCTAPTRVIAHRSVYDQLVAMLTAAAGHMKVGDPL